MATSTDENKISMMFTLLDGKKGILCDALQVLKKYDINITYINSKPSKFTSSISKNVDFFIDVEKPIKDEDLVHAINDLKKYVENFELIENEEVPWFPKCLGDINLIGKQTMTAGVELESDHPGFNDPVYRQRRSEIAKTSENYIIGQPHPIIEYTEEEKKLWNKIWDLLAPLHKQYACEEFNENKKIFMNEMNFRGKEIPQLGEISNFLKKRTNTIFRPVDGLLTQREFLNSLAFGVFSSTQYIRHHSMPLYTPEPDIIHEFLGHAPMFANKDFSDFSQEIGLASLGASDEEIKKLGTIYWFTIEFGVTIEDGKKKIYGGGILSSPSETEWAASSKPKFHEFDIDTIASFPYTITKIQEDYFLAPSFKKMKEAVRKYSDSIKRPFNVSYNVDTNVVTIDRKYKTKKL
jgi:phenylalanine-4-hydroxylase